ncbi:uncharacterized protein LOC143018055 isoform X2 [Oratosquilla oratoria]|uniref:uncharacterized protein LOC143018055 isoform X2 n=1 Tax=Oratosquilla oratoria TaxID=337810 RepID=UPI003F76A308
MMGAGSHRSTEGEGGVRGDYPGQFPGIYALDKTRQCKEVGKGSFSCTGNKEMGLFAQFSKNTRSSNTCTASCPSQGQSRHFECGEYVTSKPGHSHEEHNHKRSSCISGCRAKTHLDLEEARVLFLSEGEGGGKGGEGGSVVLEKGGRGMGVATWPESAETKPSHLRSDSARPDQTDFDKLPGLDPSRPADSSCRGLEDPEELQDSKGRRPSCPETYRPPSKSGRPGSSQRLHKHRASAPAPRHVMWAVGVMLMSMLSMAGACPLVTSDWQPKPIGHYVDDVQIVFFGFVTRLHSEGKNISSFSSSSSSSSSSSYSSSPSHSSYSHWGDRNDIYNEYYATYDEDLYDVDMYHPKLRGKKGRQPEDAEEDEDEDEEPKEGEEIRREGEEGEEEEEEISYTAELFIVNVFKGAKLLAEFLGVEDPGSGGVYNLRDKRVNVTNFGSRNLCLTPVSPQKTYIVLADVLQEKKDKNKGKGKGRGGKGRGDNGKGRRKGRGKGRGGKGKGKGGRGKKYLAASYPVPFAAAVEWKQDLEDDVWKALGWDSWDDWSPCNVTCGGGAQERTRYCLRDVEGCEGYNKERRRCNTLDCDAAIDVLRLEDERYNPVTFGWRPSTSRPGAFRAAKNQPVLLHTRDLFRNGFPPEFSLLISVRPEPDNKGLLFIMHRAFSGEVYLGLGLGTSLELIHTGAGRSSFLPINIVPFTLNLTDGKWHQLGLSVRDDSTIQVHFDCRWLSRQNLRRATLEVPEDTLLYVGGMPGRSFEGEIEQFTISRSPDAVTQQCKAEPVPFIDTTLQEFGRPTGSAPLASEGEDSYYYEYSSSWDLDDFDWGVDENGGGGGGGGGEGGGGEGEGGGEGGGGEENGVGRSVKPTKEDPTKGDPTAPTPTSSTSTTTTTTTTKPVVATTVVGSKDDDDDDDDTENDVRKIELTIEGSGQGQDVFADDEDGRQVLDSGLPEEFGDLEEDGDLGIEEDWSSSGDDDTLALIWSSWSDCSVSCGGGMRTRSGLCPQHLHHEDCVWRDRTQAQACNLHPCNGDHGGASPGGERSSSDGGPSWEGHEVDLMLEVVTATQRYITSTTTQQIPLILEPRAPNTSSTTTTTSTTTPRPTTTTIITTTTLLSPLPSVTPSPSPPLPLRPPWLFEDPEPTVTPPPAFQSSMMTPTLAPPTLAPRPFVPVQPSSVRPFRPMKKPTLSTLWELSPSPSPTPQRSSSTTTTPASTITTTITSIKGSEASIAPTITTTTTTPLIKVDPSSRTDDNNNNETITSKNITTSETSAIITATTTTTTTSEASPSINTTTYTSSTSPSPSLLQDPDRSLNEVFPPHAGGSPHQLAPWTPPGPWSPKSPSPYHIYHSRHHHHSTGSQHQLSPQHQISFHHRHQHGLPDSSYRECFPGCLHDGVCLRAGVCRCRPGWYGRRCEVAVCYPPCMNGGTCVRPDTCSCTTEYTGPQCQFGGGCWMTCLHGGTCVGRNKCSCPSGWGGLRCQVPRCRSACRNGGRCLAPNTCSCTPGYTGRTCETPLCDPPCVNGGTCVRPYYCQCPAGTQGALCQNFVCPGGCGHAGRCIGPGECRCGRGWGGPTCTDPQCNPPCLNGGTCTAPNTCTCPKGFTGSCCQNKKCVYKPHQVAYSRSYRKVVPQRVETQCGAWGWKTCTSVRHIYQTVRHTFYKTIYSCVSPP